MEQLPRSAPICSAGRRRDRRCSASFLPDRRARGRSPHLRRDAAGARPPWSRWPGTERHPRLREHRRLYAHDEPLPRSDRWPIRQPHRAWPARHRWHRTRALSERGSASSSWRARRLRQEGVGDPKVHPRGRPEPHPWLPQRRRGRRVSGCRRRRGRVHAGACERTADPIPSEHGQEDGRESDQSRLLQSGRGRVR